MVVFLYLVMDSISIHAPRAGSDLEIGLSDTATDISIHAPRAGSDIPGWCN